MGRQRVNVWDKRKWLCKSQKLFSIAIWTRCGVSKNILDAHAAGFFYELSSPLCAFLI